VNNAEAKIAQHRFGKEQGRQASTCESEAKSGKNDFNIKDDASNGRQMSETILVHSGCAEEERRWAGSNKQRRTTIGDITSKGRHARERGTAAGDTQAGSDRGKASRNAQAYNE
jgi:hypothetical protein